MDKFFFKQWVVGICRGNIQDIIKTKKFDPEINWLSPMSLDKIQADPFLLDSDDGNIKILYEESKFREGYGKIALMTLNKDFTKINSKVLLDTQSHLSYPFVFRENDKYYMFPEAAASGKLSCYEYDTINEKTTFIKDIIDLPLRDSTILKHNNKYWLLGALGSNTTTYELHIFFSNELTGPYFPHTSNPVKTGLDGVRPAGNFLEINGEIFRPAQNCKNGYGDSITLLKIRTLDEREFSEEEYMRIEINKMKKNNKNIHTIHTLNVMNDILVVDGKRWVFSPLRQLRKKLKELS